MLLSLTTAASASAKTYSCARASFEPVQDLTGYRRLTPYHRVDRDILMVHEDRQ